MAIFSQVGRLSRSGDINIFHPETSKLMYALSPCTDEELSEERQCNGWEYSWWEFSGWQILRWEFDGWEFSRGKFS